MYVSTVVMHDRNDRNERHQKELLNGGNSYIMNNNVRLCIIKTIPAVPVFD
jgi:hypothetical protein